MRNNQFNVLTGPSNASKNGAAFDTGQVFNLTAQIYFSDGDSAGTVKLQGSNDAPPAGYNSGFVPANWVDIPSATATITSSGAAVITVTNLCYRWTRAVWTHSGGGAADKTINVQANVQGV